ncbi:MAG: hypothetical protein JW850_11225 [Thermoflexales bacterium]|nr:hypothetical protein [Thermoflexales bacterium]
MKRTLYLTSVALIVGLLSACSLLASLGGTPANPPAAEMLPQLSGYKVVEGQTLTDYLSTLGEGATLLAAQPELTAVVAAVDGIVTCYQDVGAVRSRLYSDQANPLSAGAVAIADRNALLNPLNLFKCVGSNLDLDGSAAPGGLQPCTANYTLTRDGNEFYIVYAGTTLEICQAFCSKLEGCTAHR